MDPLTGASAFATIVGLLCNWKQERASNAQNRYQDFMEWLTLHQFDSLTRLIQESQDLQLGLNSLLQADLQTISSKLDVLCGSFSSIAARIPTIATVEKALPHSASNLTDQACEILKIFADAEGGEFTDLPSGQPRPFG